MGALAAGFMLAGCGLGAVDGLSSGGELVDRGHPGKLADAEQEHRDAPSDIFTMQDASPGVDGPPDSQWTPDTQQPSEVGVDDASSDVVSLDGESLDGGDTSDAMEAGSDATGGKLPIVNVISSSNVASHPPAASLDGDLSSWWAGSGDGVWIQYDLGAPRTLTVVKLAWHVGGARVYTYDVLVSMDAVIWSTEFAGAHNDPANTLQDNWTDNVRARYVRVVGHLSSVDNYTNVSEAEIWGN
jgi:hypothetical protein